MIILTIRTDRPEAEIGLYQDAKQLANHKWLADRQLTKTIHKQIQEMLNKSSINWTDVGGVIIYEGPGSFTGLRIGISVANALAYANDVPAVATGGDKWIEDGLKKLDQGTSQKITLPKYGTPPNITKPK